MTAIQVIMTIAFIIATLGWMVGVYNNYKESKKKSRWFDPHDQIYH